MAQVLEFKKSDPEIGLSLRAKIEGPETDLLNQFIGQYVNKLHTVKRDCALFYEPLLPTGYPDLVIVTYTPNKYESWSKARTKLGRLELKVLHHLYFTNETTSSAIEQQLGIESRSLLRIMERLMDASMVRRTRQQWRPKPLSSSYGINNIKTIEAKISDWPSVIDQANANRLFSSESCVLSPVSKPSERIIINARSNGIGIYSMPLGKQAKIIQKPIRSNGLPVSYASWLFNEWIGRRLLKGRGVI